MGLRKVKAEENEDEGEGPGGPGSIRGVYAGAHGHAQAVTERENGQAPPRVRRTTIIAGRTPSFSTMGGAMKLASAKTM